MFFDILFLWSLVEVSLDRVAATAPFQNLSSFLSFLLSSILSILSRTYHPSSPSSWHELLVGWQISDKYINHVKDIAHDLDLKLCVKYAELKLIRCKRLPGSIPVGDATLKFPVCFWKSIFTKCKFYYWVILISLWHNLYFCYLAGILKLTFYVFVIYRS